MVNTNKINSVMLGLSLPQEIVEKIDRDRGDIPRSRFLTRLVELAYSTGRVKRHDRF